jgi:hypothetical protein
MWRRMNSGEVVVRRKSVVRWARAQRCLSRERDKLRETLEAVEWIADGPPEKGYPLSCPLCCHEKSAGHEPGCKIAAALGRILC